MKRVGPAFAFLVVLLTTLEILVRKEWISSSLVPSPSMVWSVFLESPEDFRAAFFQTLLNTLCGLALSLFVGNLLAFLFSTADLLKRALLPFAVFFQTVPIIAIAPLLVIYFGFGAPTVIASSFIVSLFPVIANTLVGLENVPRAQLDLFKLYRASSWQILLKLRWPHAIPTMVAGLQIAAGLAIVGAVAGEFVAGTGLGSLIDSARTQQRIDMVFAALFLLSLMGLMILAGFKLVHFMFRRRRA